MKTRDNQTKLETSIPEKMRKKRKGERVQGKEAEPAALNVPNGDDYAHAVGKIMEESKAMKGSQQGFLGVATEHLDPREYTKRETSLNVKKRSKKQQGE